MEHPKVSIIVPAFNASKYINDCLQSLLEQTYNEKEIIVVDDCSTDNTFQIAEKHCKTLRTDRNSGAGAARNLGIINSSGNILAFTDADVVVPPNWVDNIVKIMEQEKVDCVGGGYIGSIGDSFIEYFAFYELLKRRERNTLYVNTFVSNNFACKRHVFEDVGLFPVDYKCASLEDMVLSYKIAKKYKIYWMRDNGVYHNFKKTISAYLKQQFIFARDTLITYFNYPELFKIKTHQGRKIYLETLLTGLLIPLSLFNSLFIPLYIIAIFGINFIFLLFLREKSLSSIKAYFVIILRNVSCFLGVLNGVIILIKKIFIRK